METKNKITPEEDYKKSFGFERALMLMREGRKVRQLRSPKVFEIKENTLLCDGFAVLSLGIESIVQARWMQVR